MKRGINKISELLNDISATQLLEEGLLICVSLFMLAVMLGVVHNAIKMVGSFFDQTWKTLEEIAKGLFGWI